jgi:AraC-like DNA-binding protein
MKRFTLTTENLKPSDQLQSWQSGTSICVFERATRIIDAELKSSRFQPSKLSSRLGVSRSGLYRLFKPHGGVARYIKKRRLLRVFEALGDPEIRETIAALAAVYGFDDPSNFCRAFRREFGRSAGDVRASALADMALSSGSARKGEHAPMIRRCNRCDALPRPL